MNYKFTFTCKDNGGKYQCFIIFAPDKTTATAKGLAKARKNAKGDFTSWVCHLGG